MLSETSTITTTLCTFFFYQGLPGVVTQIAGGGAVDGCEKLRA